jgi:hypothetical protein
MADALRYLADAHVHLHALESEHPGQQGDKHKGVHRVEQHLEHRVEGHEAGRVVAVTLGQFVPDDHHGDAAGQSDQDDALHESRLVEQEQDGEEEHEERSDDPVLHQGESQDLPVAKDVPQLLVVDLGQRRIHHDDEADGDGDGGGADGGALDGFAYHRPHIARPDADGHGQEDPEGEETV